MKYLKGLILEIIEVIKGNDIKAKQNLLEIVIGFTAILNLTSDILYIRLLAQAALILIVLKGLGAFKDW